MSTGPDPLTLRVGETLTCRAAIEGKVVAFDARVLHVDAAGLYLDRPSGLNAQLMAGTELLVRYIRSDAAYQFLSRIREVPAPADPDEELVAPEPDPSRLVLRHNPLILRYPARITRFQRRAYPRAHQEGIVQVRRTGGDSRDWRGYIVNLSAGGVRFATKQAGFFEGVTNPVGLRLLVSLLMPKGLDLQGLLAEVRRVTVETGVDGEDYLVIQASFADLPTRERARIQTWVEKYGGDSAD